MENKKIREILTNGSAEQIKKLKEAMIKQSIEENREALKRLADS